MLLAMTAVPTPRNTTSTTQIMTKQQAHAQPQPNKHTLMRPRRRAVWLGEFHQLH